MNNKELHTNFETHPPHISVAPMMDWTDRHCRYFLRLIAPHVRLYTEMVTTGALIHGDKDRFLRFDEAEHPIALQLGGSNPDDLATCAKMGENYGYDEINLNCGCPSDRVQSGAFGACLMKEPKTVAACVEAMAKTVNIPVTIKCRIGIDNDYDFEFLDNFVSEVANKGCGTFIIHARKAWLKGLSPKENREVPALDYKRVKEIKLKHPDLNIIVNGGVKTTDDINTLLRHPVGEVSSPRLNKRDPYASGKTAVFSGSPLYKSAKADRGDDSVGFDGVMIGREAYQNPYFLTEIEKEIFNNQNTLTREDIAMAMVPYIQEQMERDNVPLKSMTRHMIGLFHGQPGGRAWRQALSTLPYEPDAKADIILKALETRQTHTRKAA